MEYFVANATSFIALRDGEVYIGKAGQELAGDESFGSSSPDV